MRGLVVATLLFGSAFATECQVGISLEQAINNAKQFVGEVRSAHLSKSKANNECYYRVRGSEGTALIDAKDGKLIRFYRKRD